MPEHQSTKAPPGRSAARTEPADDAAGGLERELARLPLGAYPLKHGSDGFPQRLNRLAAPPDLVYVLGDVDVLSRTTVAMVGSRRIDAEGVRVTRKLATELARDGAILISGGALGVDTLVHQAALDANVPTVVVLPSGLDLPTPRSNTALFRRVVEAGGLVLSELPAGTSARRHHFHRRNKLIAALGDHVVLARAREDGGTHITARAARDLGVPLYAIPGSPEDPFSAGCLSWIRGGAKPVWRARHIFPDAVPEVAPYAAPVLSESEERLLNAIEQGDTDLDQLSARLKLGVPAVQHLLLELELRGIIRKDPHSRGYRLCA